MSRIPKVINSVWDRGRSRATFLIMTAKRHTAAIAAVYHCHKHRIAYTFLRHGQFHMQTKLRGYRQCGF